MIFPPEFILCYKHSILLTETTNQIAELNSYDSEKIKKIQISWKSSNGEQNDNNDLSKPYIMMGKSMDFKKIADFARSQLIDYWELDKKLGM